MNPIYLKYLELHPKGDGVATTANGEPLYKFINWAHGKAEEYKKMLKEEHIADKGKYLRWLKKQKA